MQLRVAPPAPAMVLHHVDVCVKLKHLQQWRAIGKVCLLPFVLRRAQTTYWPTNLFEGGGEGLLVEEVGALAH